MITCNLGNNKINCFDGIYTKEQLKKWSSKGILLCEACGKPYEYCHGRVITPYFRHKDKNLCEDKYCETETDEHIQGKKDLYEWIKSQDGVTDVELEAWLPETKQRPDIMFKYNGKKCVMEYQCSPIATEYYERHELYQAAGINDIWICGTEKYLQRGMREKCIGKESVGYYNPNNKKLYFTSDIYPSYPYINYLNYYSDINIKITNIYGKTLYVRPLDKFRTSRNNILFDSQLSEIQSRCGEMINKRRKRNNDRKSFFSPGENKHKGYKNKYLNKEKEIRYSLYSELNKKLEQVSNENWNIRVYTSYSRYSSFSYIKVDPIIHNENNVQYLQYMKNIKLWKIPIGIIRSWISDEELLRYELLNMMIENKNKIIKYFSNQDNIRLFY